MQMFIAFLLGLATMPAAPQTAKPVYEVYAVRYAVIQDFPVAGLVKDADPARKLDIAMMVWLVRGNGRNIVVDSGFYHERLFKDWKIKDFVRPSEALLQAGVKPEDVTDVIITHMHWDHADGMDLFPKARIWIQKDEYTYYTGAAWQAGGKHGGIEPVDVLTIVKLNTQSQVNLVDGDDREIIDGVRVYTRCPDT